MPRPTRTSGMTAACIGLVLLGWLGEGAAPSSMLAAPPGVESAPAEASSAPAPADATAAAGSTQDPSAQKQALAQFNSLVGEWRGTGQPRRGSSQGAWKETAEWLWDFTDGVPALKLQVTGGKQATSGRLTSDPAAGTYTLVLQSPDESAQTYSGRLDEDKLVLETAAADGAAAHRLTLTLLNDKRTLLLFERRLAGQQNFGRVAEVGYTREGTRLAVSGASGPECIVTGGAGTIEVRYQGKTYYVCCSGCRQAFEDDPEGILAEAQARRERAAAERDSK